MRLLIDQNLPLEAARYLSRAGHDVVHTRDRGLERATDQELLDFARVEARVIVTLDLDFPRLIVASALQEPSVILLRERGLLPEEVFRRVEDVCPRYPARLDAGCLITVDSKSVRLRGLPISAKPSGRGG